MLCHCSRGNHACRYPDVFWPKEGCSEVVIFHVNGHPMFLLRYDRVYEQFYHRHCSCLSRSRSVVIDAVTAWSSANAENDIAGSVGLLLGLRIKVGSIGTTVIWLAVQVDRLHSMGFK